MKLRSMTVPLLSLLAVGLFVTNGVQLASPFSAPFGPDFLNDFRRRLVNAPL